MSWLKFSIVLSTGVLLVGLSSTAAMSQEAAPPRDHSDGWDSGPPRPASGHPGPGGPHRAGDARRPQPPQGDEDGPPGPPDMRGDGPRPPQGDNAHRPPRPHGEDRDRLPYPGDPQGNRRQPGPPHGPPPGYPPRGHEDFDSLKTSDPELFKAIHEDRDLERQSCDRADQYRRAGKDEQAKIKEQLLEIVNKHFEVRQQLRSLEVKRLEQQLKQLRDKIDQRAKDRKDIVEKRIIELTGADEGERF